MNEQRWARFENELGKVVVLRTDTVLRITASLRLGHCDVALSDGQELVLKGEPEELMKKLEEAK
jgi:hypothetical protein